MFAATVTVTDTRQPKQRTQATWLPYLNRLRELRQADLRVRNIQSLEPCTGAEYEPQRLCRHSRAAHAQRAQRLLLAALEVRTQELLPVVRTQHAALAGRDAHVVGVYLERLQAVRSEPRAEPPQAFTAWVSKHSISN